MSALAPLLPILTPGQWGLLVLAGFCVGLGKGGFAGVGLIPMLLFAEVFPAKLSTGLLLVPLILGDLTAVNAFHQHADWRQIRRVLPPAAIGIVVGWWSLSRLSNAELRPLIGAIVLGLVALQLVRGRLGKWIEAGFHSRGFAWALGGLGGWTTMLANAAGPVMGLYFLAIRLPKLVYVGTAAWFFCVINWLKVPFSISLGLITPPGLLLAAVLAPAIIGGVFAGRWLLHRVPQLWFERLVLIAAVAGALRLLLA
jgi:hypothetical protein